ncbi:SixA phosphatase family protein [Snuella sedimenti]|uniref:Histidine phosphatase family protein n=1 Tax=Snuella sedimenti TaxID=2798802 RepID=A0A8J7J6N5_9FLAO|nr:histidine phosphatase family protein [Snuella sedimenti]MBJ6369434.1 histidine phosphatase family protein [Snuella sedimenti]
MKTLTLIRHAKSSWEYDVIDHERPLKERGVNDAKLVSKYFKISLRPPDLVLSSDANRAKSTAAIFVKTLDIDSAIFHLKHDLYDFAGYNLLEVIKACDETVNNLMVFGHNHAITDFVNIYGHIYIENVPTSGVVVLEFDITRWADLKKGRTVQTLFPRDLKPN